MSPSSPALFVVPDYVGSFSKHADQIENRSVYPQGPRFPRKK